MGACCSTDAANVAASSKPAANNTGSAGGQVDAVSVYGKKLDIKFYYDPLSQPVRSIMTLLDLANVKHEAIFISILKGDQNKPEFLKINRKGQIPTLMINGKSYSESAANLRLLCQLLPTLAKTGYYPEDEFMRHAVNAALDFNGSSFRKQLIGRNMCFFAQMQAGGKISDELKVKIDDANAEVYKAQQALEKLVVEGNCKFICGDQPTIADIQLYHQSNDIMLQGNSWADFPKCMEWRAHMYEIPQIKTAQNIFNRECFAKLSFAPLPSGTNIDLPQNERDVINEMQSFWFPGEKNDRHRYAAKECFQLHFSNKSDKVITDKYLSWFEKLEKGELENWRNDHDGRLAYIIIADQFSRSMFRGQARAFSQDSKAYELSKSIIDDKEKMSCYRNHEQIFIILAVQHNENIESVNRANQEMDEAILRCDALGNMDFRGLFTLFRKFGTSHLDPIEKFGRYPGRNAAMGRESTPEEVAFLKAAPSWAKPQK